MNKTAIEYLDYTYNPLAMRCTPVSEGCAHCWHLRMADRLAKNPKLPDEERAAYAGEGPPVLRQRELEAPLKHKKPAVIGVQLMGDLGHEDLYTIHIAPILAIAAMCPQHTFLLLTKRPQALAKLIEDTPRVLSLWKHPAWYEGSQIATMLLGLDYAFFPPNVWPGVTVENQSQIWRIEELLKIPAARHWVSLEPLLSAIDFKERKPPCSHKGCYHHVSHPCEGCGRVQGFIPLRLLDGIVVGGESGPKARPCHPDWIRDIRDACVEAGVAFTYKQHGEWLHGSQIQQWVASKFRGELEWAGTLAADRIRWDQKRHEWPDGSRSYWVTNKGAGRLLDGKVWDEFPWRLLDEQTNASAM